MMMRPHTSSASRLRISLPSATWPSYSSPVVAGHQQDSRAVAVLDAGDRDRDPAIGRAVHRIGQPDKAVLFAIAVKIDFGGETAPRAGHQWLLYARRSSPFDSMKVLCLICTQYRLDTGNSWRDANHSSTTPRIVWGIGENGLGDARVTIERAV